MAENLKVLEDHANKKVRLIYIYVILNYFIIKN